MTNEVQQAVSVLHQGGVIAYPTEYCFGLGCDPANKNAVQRILDIKHRSVDQGLILIAADTNQITQYCDIESSPCYEQIISSWPGPVTWTLAAHPQVPGWLTGKHKSIAMRVTEHFLSADICKQFGGAIVSTSANRHAQPALLTNNQVAAEMGMEIDYIVAAEVGDAKQASKIFDGITGARLR